MKRTAGEIAEHLGVRLKGDPRVTVESVAAPERARAADLIYADSPRHIEQAARSAAGCVLARPGAKLPGKTVLEVEEPKLAFAKASAWLLEKRESSGRVHPGAIVAPSARLGREVEIGPYAVVEENVEIGRASIVEAFCFLGSGSRIGDDCRLHPRVTIYPGVRIGTRVEIHSGAVIGGDGFGYVAGEERQWKFPQIGTVEIGDDVEIGCNATIDRGSLETTKIGAGAKIDNLVQIAHNVEIGEHTVIAAQTGVSGSSKLGRGVMVGGQVGIADHCRLEDGAIAGAQAGIPTGKTIRRGQVVWGTPARPLKRFKEQYAWFGRLPELGKRLRQLEEKCGIESEEGEGAVEG
jgi:UDP-3-O-[3-hydroxymyristoyl] glucosamine N-acyltransferase